MNAVQEEGILLRSHPYSETSRVVRILTPGRGVLPLMGRGLRRRVQRGEGGVDTFDQVRIAYTFRSGRDLQTLTEMEVVRSRQALGRDLVRFAGASLLAEFLLAHALEEGNPTLFREVEAALDRLLHAPSTEVPGALLSAAWRILAHLGFAPELDACVQCGHLLEEGQGAGLGEGLEEGGAPALLRFSAHRGGLLCPECGAGEAGSRLGPGARADLRAMLGGTAPEKLRGAGVHLALLEVFALHHLAPQRAFRSVVLVRTGFAATSAGGADSGNLPGSG